MWSIEFKLYERSTQRRPETSGSQVRVSRVVSKDLVVVDKGDYTNNEHLATVLDLSGCSELVVSWPSASSWLIHAKDP